MSDTVAQSAVASFMSTLTDASAVRVPAELDRWSNRLAHLLISLGVERGAPVAVALTPSVESIVAKTAIAKAGAKTVVDYAAAVIGVTTKAQRAGLTDAVDWLILDDVATVRRYMTMPDVAPKG